MANTIVISKKLGGTVLVVTTSGTEYNLLPGYRVRKTPGGKVEVLTDLGGLIDTFDPVEVEKVVLIDGTDVAIADADTLFTQLHTNFFNESDDTEDLQIDEDVVGQATTTYIGTAIPGTAKGVSKWQIRKVVVVIVGVDSTTDVTFPELAGKASLEFAFEWDERTNLVYS